MAAQGTCGSRWTASTSLALILSMHSAEASTPDPTYGTPASSSRPCTVPSSPWGPCRSGMTTTGNPSPDGATVGRGSTAVPVARSGAGSAAAPAASAARAVSSRTQAPSRVMPTASSW